nr:hypothetical protein [Nostoc sp. DedQUE02]
MNLDSQRLRSVQVARLPRSDALSFDYAQLPRSRCVEISVQVSDTQ